MALFWTVKSPEDGEFERLFFFFSKTVVGGSGSKIQEFFADKDVKGNFVVPALDVRARILSIYDRRNGVGKPVSKLAHSDTNKCSMSLLLICVNLIFLMLCHIVDQTSTLAQIREANCVMAAFSPPRLFAAWRVEAFQFFAALSFGGPCYLRFVHMSIPS